MNHLELGTEFHYKKWGLRRRVIPTILWILITILTGCWILAEFIYQPAMDEVTKNLLWFITFCWLLIFGGIVFLRVIYWLDAYPTLYKTLIVNTDGLTCIDLKNSSTFFAWHQIQKISRPPYFAFTTPFVYVHIQVPNTRKAPPFLKVSPEKTIIKRLYVLYWQASSEEIFQIIYLYWYFYQKQQTTFKNHNGH